MQEVLEHLQAALAILDTKEQHAAASQIDYLIHELQASIAAEIGAL